MVKGLHGGNESNGRFFYDKCFEVFVGVLLRSKVMSFASFECKRVNNLVNHRSAFEFLSYSALYLLKLSYLRLLTPRIT